MKKQIKGTIQLTLTAIIWGVAFVAQSVGMDHVGPWTFTCIRFILGALFLIPFICVSTKKAGADVKTICDKKVRDETIKGGLLCGLFLVSATLFQQYGIMSSSVGKAGFITSLYIIIVPFLSIFLHKKIGLNEWISALIAVAGFYIMSISGHSGIGRGDVFLLICAFLFSMQILSIDRFIDHVDPVSMSCVQFMVSAVVGATGMLILERPGISDLLLAAVPILYAGIMSSGVGYTLQILGQKNLNPTPASLLMSLESVFSAIAGYFILHQILSTKETIGCILVFAGVILAQIKTKKE